MNRELNNSDADYCARWLASQGLDVIAIQKGPVLPIVIIRASELCKRFEGQAKAYERGPKGEARYRFVTRLGCEVRWAETGGAQ